MMYCRFMLIFVSLERFLFFILLLSKGVFIICWRTVTKTGPAKCFGGFAEKRVIFCECVCLTGLMKMPKSERGGDLDIYLYQLFIINNPSFQKKLKKFNLIIPTDASV